MKATYTLWPVLALLFYYQPLLTQSDPISTLVYLRNSTPWKMGVISWAAQQAALLHHSSSQQQQQLLQENTKALVAAGITQIPINTRFLLSFSDLPLDLQLVVGRSERNTSLLEAQLFKEDDSDTPVACITLAESDADCIALQLVQEIITNNTSIVRLTPYQKPSVLRERRQLASELDALNFQELASSSLEDLDDLTEGEILFDEKLPTPEDLFLAYFKPITPAEVLASRSKSCSARLSPSTPSREASPQRLHRPATTGHRHIRAQTPKSRIRRSPRAGKSQLTAQARRAFTQSANGTQNTDE